MVDILEFCGTAHTNTWGLKVGFRYICFRRSEKQTKQNKPNNNFDEDVFLCLFCNAVYIRFTEYSDRIDVINKLAILPVYFTAAFFQ
jgi:hypothetical protein